MTKPSFVYVTYVATTPEKVWQALVDTDVTRKYWADPTSDSHPVHVNVSDWKPGSQGAPPGRRCAHSRYCWQGCREHPSASLGYYLG
jgi:uncharacterized protein YndB with AHSA1/START domain